MDWKAGLLAARHHLAFLVGLALSAAMILAIENWDAARNPARSDPVVTLASFSLPAQRPLTDEEMGYARIAWRYFQNNTQDSGLVNSADRYPAAALWDSASYLLATISARRLGVITADEFDQRISAALAAFQRMPLFGGQLPNKSYNTRTLDMVDYNNQPTERGIGWSAIDLGRVLVPLNILVWDYPQHTAEVNAVLQRWNFGALAQDGLMIGAAIDADQQVQHPQEGRLGYEQYAAKSFLLMGLDVYRAVDYREFLRYVVVYGLQIPVDRRDPAQYGAHNYTLSEPYVLDGLEYGWDAIGREFAHRVYLAQQARYEATGVLTAVSEDNIDEAPYFVYNTVYSAGEAWKAVTPDGTDASDHRAVSTKAAFGWHALYDTDYTRALMGRVASLNDPERGFFSGWYEQLDRPNRALTANTNAVILESLCYRANGPLVTGLRLRRDRQATGGGPDAATAPAS